MLLGGRGADFSPTLFAIRRPADLHLIVGLRRHRQKLSHHLSRCRRNFRLAGH